MDFCGNLISKNSFIKKAIIKIFFNLVLLKAQRPHNVCHLCHMMHVTNIKSYESKDLQTFFEVLRLKIIKRQYKKTFKSDQEHFSVIQICQVLIFIMDYQNNYVKTS